MPSAANCGEEWRNQPQTPFRAPVFKTCNRRSASSPYDLTTPATSRNSRVAPQAPRDPAFVGGTVLPALQEQRAGFRGPLAPQNPALNVGKILCDFNTISPEPSCASERNCQPSFWRNRCRSPCRSHRAEYRMSPEISFHPEAPLLHARERRTRRSAHRWRSARCSRKPSMG